MSDFRISFIVLAYSIVELVLLCQFLSTHDKSSYLVFRYLILQITSL